jgi:hypothetical protein
VTAKVRPFSGFIFALMGPIVWAMHFFIVYGLEAAVCAKVRSPALTMRWIIAVATAAAVMGLAAFLIRRVRKRPREPGALGILHEISVYLSLISIGAILVVAASALRLSACVQPAG